MRSPNHPLLDLQRRDFCQLAAAVALTSLAPTVAANVNELRVPKSIRLISGQLKFTGYLVTRLGAHRIASAVMSISSSVDKYQIELSVESFLADLTYSSRGRVGEWGLEPVEYSEQRKTPFRSLRKKHVRFEQTNDQNKINTRDGDVLFVPARTQDRLSVLFQYSLLARANKQVLGPAMPLEIPFARVGRVTPSHWSAARSEAVSLGSADIRDDELGRAKLRQAHRIARVADNNETLDVAFWLDASPPHQPMVLQFSERGRSLRFVAE